MKKISMFAFAFAICAAGKTTTFAEDQPKPDPGFGEWITIFDGKSFDGWEVSKPANAKFNWTIEDGAMTNDVSNLVKKHNIATKRKFHNFEAELDFKTAPGANSGIYMRGRAEIQIKDGPYEPGGDGMGISDMGALYKYKAPLVKAGKPAGEWNHIYIRFIGTHVTAVLNGQLIQNNTFIDHKTGQGRTDEFDSPGIFELQGDHDKVWFRNIRIRPLFEGEGWRSLFNGKDTTGWIASKEYGKSDAGGEMKWKVEEGNLLNGMKIPDIVSNDKFGNFLVHYEYKSDGNSGFFLRDLWEIQIELANRNPNKNSDGALYDFYPPKANATKPHGEWNVIEAKVVGRKITVFQNGLLTHDNAECPGRTYRTSDSSNMDAPGPVRLQGDHGRVWFTNIWVKPLN